MTLRVDRHSRFVPARLAGRLIATLASATLLACTSAPTDTRSVLAGTAARNVLILPLNVTAILSPELASLKEPVWADLETYLRAGSWQLRTASFSDAHKLWMGSIQKARAAAKGRKVGFDEAARLLVVELSKHAEFDTLVIPSLFIREAPISGNAARWDGVERALELERNGRSGEERYVDTTYVGVAPAASLHTVVLDSNGRKLQDRVGGLELLARVRVKAVGGPGDPVELEFTPFNGPFTNAGNIREGITLALSPFFLPPLRSGSE